MLLAVPAAAHGHAWGPPRAIGLSEAYADSTSSLGAEPVVRAVANRRGDLAVAWTSIGRDRVSLMVARAPASLAPSDIGVPELVATGAGHEPGLVVLDVVITTAGDVGVLLSRLEAGQSRTEVVVAPAGKPFGDPVELDAWHSGAAIAADDRGRIVTMALGAGAAQLRRWAAASGWESLPSVPATGHLASLASSAGQLVLATADDAETRVIHVDPTTGDVQRTRTFRGFVGRVSAGPAGHVAVAARDYQHVQLASAAPGGALSALQDLSGSRMVHEYRPTFAPDGTVAIGWGGPEWVHASEDVLLAMGPAGGPLQRVASPPVANIMGWGRIPMAFDADSRLVALGAHVKGQASPYADGRVALTTRIGAAWCAPEVLSEDAYDRRAADLAFDGVGGGAAAWRDRASGEVRVARYAAREDCPPQPPPPDPQPPPPHILEHMQTRPPEPSAPTPADRLPSKQPPVVVPPTATVRPSGAISLRLRCALRTACRGTFELRARSRAWARRTIALRAGRTQRVTLRLNRRGRRGLSRRTSVKATAVTRLRGRPAARRAITLRRRR